MVVLHGKVKLSKSIIKNKIKKKSKLRKYYLTNAITICKGKKTKVFKRSKNSIPSNKCFSIIFKNRTIDLQAGSQTERDIWVEYIQKLLTV